MLFLLQLVPVSPKLLFNLLLKSCSLALPYNIVPLVYHPWATFDTINLNTAAAKQLQATTICVWTVRMRQSLTIRDRSEVTHAGPCIYGFFVFRFQICERKTDNEFVFRFSFSNLRTKNEFLFRFSFSKVK